MKLSTEDIWSIELGQKYSIKNLPEIRHNLLNYLDLLLFLHEVLAEEKVPLNENEVLSEELLMKFYLHGISIHKISETYQLSSKYFSETFSKVKFIDISSLLTVGRAQLETLLMYQHLYMNSEDQDEQKLRFFAWIYTALIQRIKIPAESEEAKIQRKKDLAEIDRLKNAMQSLNPFNALSQKQQNNLLETGSVKLFKHWNTIFKESGFEKNELLTKLYYILSAYSHSEGMSVLQMKHAKYFITNKHNYELVYIQIFSSVLMTSVMIKNITRYPAVKERFKFVDKKLQHNINFFAGVAQARKEPNA